MNSNNTMQLLQKSTYSQTHKCEYREITLGYALAAYKKQQNIVKNKAA